MTVVSGLSFLALVAVRGCVLADALLLGSIAIVPTLVSRSNQVVAGIPVNASRCLPWA